MWRQAEPSRLARQLAIAAALIGGTTARASAADLKPATIAAFERYQRAAELAINADVSSPDRFLRVLDGDERHRREIDAQLRRGRVVIIALRATDAGGRIDVPDGLIHHWLGAVFIPGAHLDDAVSLLQDYDRHAQIFRPNVARSRLIERDGDRFRLYLRFYMKKGIAVTVNTESVAQFVRRGPDRVTSTIRSTRVAEVEDPGTPREREKPVGHDGGYLWRLNTYWRYLERDGGTYVECESVTLTRGIPIGFGWLIGPFVTSIPRDTLTAVLEVTRRTLVSR